MKIYLFFILFILIGCTGEVDCPPYEKTDEVRCVTEERNGQVNCTTIQTCILIN